jgi:lipopolysaccharide transport system permease protein
MFRDLYKYRNFIIQSVRNDLINRFSRSKLGGLWAILNPLSQVLIYALILSNVLAAKLPGVDSQYAYAIYLIAGLLGWTLFNEIVGRCLNIFIEHGNLIKKMSFPRAALPAIAVGSCLINNLFLFISMLGIFALLGHQFNVAMLWLIPLILIVVVFSLGIGLILGVMNVFLRDIGQVTPIILQMLFWFTPIVYPITIIPEAYRHWLNLNPMYPIIDAYQQILVYGNSPQWGGVLIILAVGIILSIVGLFMFRRSSAEMVDAL